MKKEQAEELIRAELDDGEDLKTLFFALYWPIWLLMIGPLAGLGMRQYYVGVTNRGLHFMKLGLLGQVASSDSFSYGDIIDFKTQRRLNNRVLKFQFSNGRKLRLETWHKAHKRVPTLSKGALAFVRARVAA